MTALAPTAEDLIPVQPGRLYVVWMAEDRSRGWFRCVYLADGYTMNELVGIGSDGLEWSHRVVFPEDSLDWCLAHLHAHLYWLKCGERVGPYADEVDLDALSPAAKQRALDQFAEDLLARREPRPLLPPPPDEPAPDGQRWEWED